MRDIPKIGDKVRLKPEREDDYGSSAPPGLVYTVTEIKPRKGYKIPWVFIRADDEYSFGYVKPSELERA